MANCQGWRCKCQWRVQTQFMYFASDRILVTPFLPFTRLFRPFVNVNFCNEASEAEKGRRVLLCYLFMHIISCKRQNFFDVPAIEASYSSTHAFPPSQIRWSQVEYWNYLLNITRDNNGWLIYNKTAHATTIVVRANINFISSRFLRLPLTDSLEINRAGFKLRFL